MQDLYVYLCCGTGDAWAEHESVAADPARVSLASTLASIGKSGAELPTGSEECV